MSLVSVRARFERFPATVKGAFVVRGEDSDPHQVVVREARVVGVGTGWSRPVPIAPATLDVPPRQDVFVPFELPASDLDPGWYAFECDLEVDGVSGTYPGGRRFSVPWPRATVRRGTIPVGREVRLGDARARVEQLECAGDCVKIGLTVTPGRSVSPRLLVDGTRLEVLDVEIDRETGRGRVVAYPLLRSHGVLRIELRGRGRGGEGALDVELP
ncbi:MAG TPA: hypothetical protein VFC04_06735 [Actinomycetota bacterium]|nr:hypothetical protein [Actinomycetota bacterium]